MSYPHIHAARSPGWPLYRPEAGGAQRGGVGMWVTLALDKVFDSALSLFRLSQGHQLFRAPIGFGIGGKAPDNTL